MIKFLMRHFCRSDVKIGWTIGIFLALIRSKGTAHRAAMSRQDRDKPGYLMKCRFGRGGFVALKPFSPSVFPSWLCRIGFLFGYAVWSTGVFAYRAD